METTIYRVMAENWYHDVDMDMCPIMRSELTERGVFTSKKEAIRVAQKHADKRRRFDDIVSVYAEHVGPRGIMWSKRVYRKSSKKTRK